MDAPEATVNAVEYELRIDGEVSFAAPSCQSPRDQFEDLFGAELCQSHLTWKRAGAFSRNCGPRREK